MTAENNIPDDKKCDLCVNVHCVETTEKGRPKRTTYSRADEIISEVSVPSRVKTCRAAHQKRLEELREELKK